MVPQLSLDSATSHFSQLWKTSLLWWSGHDAAVSVVVLRPDVQTPHCFFSFPCQKLDGCNKMTCTGCMQYFCWLCMASLSRVNPYKHFNDPSSPCFDRYVSLCVSSSAALLLLGSVRCTFQNSSVFVALLLSIIVAGGIFSCS